MVYITGDMHRDYSRWYGKELRKLGPGDVLIVLGDFGFLWDGSPREKRDLEYLGSRKFTVCFLDGTHENFDLLSRCRRTVWNGGMVHRVSGNLFHMMRGQVFRIQGQTFFTMGGGESPDKEMRMDGKWWREELPSPEEMRIGAENLDDAGGRVDYVLTHEPPALLKRAMLLRRGDPDRVNKLGGFLEELNRSVAFRHWYFGSMHEDRTVTPRHTALFKRVLPVGEDLSGLPLDDGFYQLEPLAEEAPLQTADVSLESADLSRQTADVSLESADLPRQTADVNGET